MEAKSIDPVEFRSAQHKQWDSAATGWKKWSGLIDEAASHVSDRMVELAGVESGSRVLDVAAGYGEPSLTAARKAGPEGQVVATDISAEMMEFGRERAEEAGLDNIEFVQSDAISLDFDSDSFDAAVSRWGIIFDPDGEGAAAKVRDLLKSDGRFAISSWGVPERVPMLSIAMKTVIERLGVEPPPPGTPGPLSRPTADALGGLLEGGGFSDVEVEETEVSMDFESGDQYATFVREIAPPVSALMADRAEDEQAQTWDAIAAAARERESDGKLTLVNLVLIAVGRA